MTKQPELGPYDVWVTRYTPTGGGHTLRVKGVTSSNPDGVPRSSLICQCRKGQKVRLVREPGNVWDEHAVQIVHQLGQIGYVHPDHSAEYWERVNDRLKLDAQIHEVWSFVPDGGDEDHPIWMVSIRVVTLVPHQEPQFSFIRWISVNVATVARQSISVTSRAAAAISDAGRQSIRWIDRQFLTLTGGNQLLRWTCWLAVAGTAVCILLLLVL